MSKRSIGPASSEGDARHVRQKVEDSDDGDAAAPAVAGDAKPSAKRWDAANFSAVAARVAELQLDSSKPASE